MIVLAILATIISVWLTFLALFGNMMGCSPGKFVGGGMLVAAWSVTAGHWLY